jgi:hypothetical protein
VSVGIAALPALAVMGIRIIGFIAKYGPQPTFPFPYRDEIQEVGSWLTSVNLGSYSYCLIAPAITYAASAVFTNEEPAISSAIRCCKAGWQSCLLMAATLWLILNLLPAVLTGPPLVQRASASLAATLAGSRRAEFLIGRTFVIGVIGFLPLSRGS